MFEFEYLSSFYIFLIKLDSLRLEPLKRTGKYRFLDCKSKENLANRHLSINV